ncbi:hypothetical protein OEZ85_006218 [Tetradesmus obliquus]|uniref:MYND-type domain-containing protein n=1 Tax=Tetradesmus obliquus TaxID=3088 RepID=A0ABY8TW66_TETOB|nr:hypothetical protein OEZ85_006218 [Tetradesmus obliquus]
MRCFGGALISLACSVEPSTLAAAITASQQPAACCRALKALDAGYRAACVPGAQHKHGTLQGTLQVFGSSAIAALREPSEAAELAEGMQRIAACVMAQVPHDYACNNPGCGSMDGTGELELVTGKSSVCSGCRAARLCSSECMKEHWDSHKPVCKRIAAANKAAAAAKQDPEAA